jgi:TRAP transporter TAXI family solute receptor
LAPEAHADSELRADEVTFFRIGTGGTGGIYYPIGMLLAQSLSGAVPRLVAVAEVSNGSVFNVRMIGSGQLEAGLVQADVAYWAYTGTGVFKGEPAITTLRAVANLYPESVHIVARKDSGIHSVRDLRGRRVSLDEAASGSIVEARIVLAAYGLAESDLSPEYVKPNLAIEKMAQGALDAFFFVGGYPAPSIAAYAAAGGATLVPIDGARADDVVAHYGFLTKSVVPAGVYGMRKATPTLEVGAQFLVSATMPDDVVYRITRTLWQRETLDALARGHPKGGLIRPETALKGIAIPLHPGAERYYRSVGILP